MTALVELIPVVGIAAACAALAVPRASYYRSQQPPSQPAERPAPDRALSPQERQAVLDLFNSEEFLDRAPAEVWATLLERGQHPCSIRTMYRILAEAGEVRERRAVATHPVYKKPELLATGPNQVWSWDITKLRGPAKWGYFQLYVILDVFSRYVVGWLVAENESEILARDLIEETCDKQRIQRDQLTLHADRGSSMKSKTVAMLLEDMGVTKSHSRPYVSDDNPYSESQFKTMKYRPEFPERFESLEAAKGFCRSFVEWYNREHHHSGIGLMTPETVHYGRHQAVNEVRLSAMTAAYETHPERFVHGPPVPPAVPKAVWINPPATSPTTRV
jgi:putative transposase